MKYDLLKDFARKIVLMGVNNHQLERVLLNRFPYNVETMDTNRNRVPATAIVMQAIHELHKENPDLQLDQNTYEALALILRESKGDGIELGLKAVEWQLYAQKENRAAFHMDCKKLLEMLQNNLKEHKAMYTNATYISVGFAQMIKEHERFINGTYKMNVQLSSVLEG